ncbi:hypothetical protein [Acaryochloris sp. IP29b_bin.148]|uniref:Pepco domain-containing protein n=1 Tax=Acaryochloris sp. IP29b_bin.148 TaxID=2969218 RepID=UPI002625CC00|nr:hypothetical protein [Acaryochloris sp. IP29b_bin.148]
MPGADVEGWSMIGSVGGVILKNAPKFSGGCAFGYGFKLEEMSSLTVKRVVKNMSDTIELWVVAEAEAAVEPGSRDSGYTGPTFRDGVDRATEKLLSITRKRVPVDVALLRKQMNNMMQVVDEQFIQSEIQTQMQLEEVELKVEINAEGQLSLVGNGGKLGNTGGITLKFSRPK